MITDRRPTARCPPGPTAVNVSSTFKFPPSFAAAARAFRDSRTTLVSRTPAASGRVARPTSTDRPSRSRRATAAGTLATTVTRHASEHDIDTSMPRRSNADRVGVRSRVDSASRPAGETVGAGSGRAVEIADGVCCGEAVGVGVAVADGVAVGVAVAIGVGVGVSPPPGSTVS
jgi:hypothetical protein